jgi:ribonucleotide monophosphatase NagD (HAD superfamily)
MIGDKETDVLFGRSLGMTSCLVRTGFGSFEEARLDGAGDVGIFDTVSEAVDWVVGGANDAE